MQRTIAVAAAAIALGFGAIAVAIAVVTAPDPSAPAGAAAPGLAEAPPGTAQAAVDPSALPTGAPAREATALGMPRPAPAGAAPAREFLPPPSVPTPRARTRPAWLEGATSRLAPRADPTPLGPLRPYVAAGMSRLQVAVAACADEAPPAGAAAPGRKGRVTLTLKLEALDNEVRIADVVPASGEAAADWRVACADRKLRGQRIHAPSRAGPRFEIPFVLNL